MQRRRTFLASLLAAAQSGADGRALAAASSVGKVRWPQPLPPRHPTKDEEILRAPLC